MTLEKHLQVPECIEKRGIGSKAYATLKYFINSGVIGGWKWRFSEREGHDIGTPETVARMLLIALGITPPEEGTEEYYYGRTQELLNLREGCQGTNIEEFAKLLIAGNLLGTDFSRSYFAPSSLFERLKNPLLNGHGPTLEGELKRYWAQKKCVQYAGSVRITREIVTDYCRTNGLMEFAVPFEGLLFMPNWLRLA